MLEPRESRTGRPLKRAISRNMLLLFVVGDVLGAGIYALVGEVAGRVGGAVWVSFMVALGLAVFTAFSYAELVTKYPNAGGAGLYSNKAFRIPFLTFLVTFAVMMSGVTSAATLATAFGGDYLAEFIDIPTVAAGLVFIVVVALINARGISESVRVNVALTVVEVLGAARTRRTRRCRARRRAGAREREVLGAPTRSPPHGRRPPPAAARSTPMIVASAILPGRSLYM